MYSEGEVDSEQRVSFAAKNNCLYKDLFRFVFCFFAFRTFLTSPVDIPRQRIYNLFMYKTEDFKWIKK